MANITANALSLSASPLQALQGASKLVIIYLLQQICGGTVAAMTATQLSLAASSLQPCQPVADLVIIYLLGQILNNGGTGGGGGTGAGGVYAANYSGAAPTFAPPGPAIATDTSTNNVYFYVNGAWVFSGLTV
jgi:hypothetical protein